MAMSDILTKIEKAAILYRDGGKIIRFLHGETATYIEVPSPPASGEGKTRVDAFLTFLDLIKEEGDLSKQNSMFLALLKSLLNSSSTLLKREVCEAILNSGYAGLTPNPSLSAAKQISAWLRDQTKTADYHLYFMQYSPIINKPGLIDKAVSFFHSLGGSKKRTALEESESTNAAGSSVMPITPG